MPRRRRPGPLPEDRRALAEDPAWLRIGRSVAKKHAKKFPHLADEFESAAHMAIVDAARTFDPDRGVKFVAHFLVRLNGAMLDAMRDAGPLGYRRKQDGRSAPKIVSADAPLPYSPGDHSPRRKSSSLGDNIPTDEHAVGWEEDGQGGLREMTKGLTSQEREVVIRLYGRADQCTMKRVGRAIGVSESRVSQLHSQAIKGIRRRMGVAT